MKIILSLISVFVLSSSFAQRDTVESRIRTNSIELNFGFIHTRLIDQGYTDSRLLFRGMNSKLRMGFSRDASTYLLRFFIQAGSGKVTSRHGGLPSDLTQAMLTLEYLRNVKRHSLFGKPVRLFAGISGVSQIYFLENSPVVDNTAIFTTQGINLALAARTTINEGQHLSVFYLLPALVSVGRVIYSEADFSHQMQTRPVDFLLSNSQMTYFSVSEFMHLRAEYEKRLSRTVSFTARYTFVYAASKFKAPVALYSNEFLVGFKFAL